jgi:hypothetical protein
MAELPSIKGTTKSDLGYNYVISASIKAAYNMPVTHILLSSK